MSALTKNMSQIASCSFVSSCLDYAHSLPAIIKQGPTGLLAEPHAEQLWIRVQGLQSAINLSL